MTDCCFPKRLSNRRADLEPVAGQLVWPLCFSGEVTLCKPLFHHLLHWDNKSLCQMDLLAFKKIHTDVQTHSVPGA